MNVEIETGLGVEGANTYVGIQEAIDFAKSRGYDLPCSVEDVRALAFKSTDYLETFSSRYSGRRVSSTQSLCYPREDSTVHCETLDSNQIPKELKYAQMYTMIAIHAGFDPFENLGNDPFVTEKTLAVLKLKYERNPRVLPKLTAALAYLKMLFSHGGSLRFVRA